MQKSGIAVPIATPLIPYGRASATLSARFAAASISRTTAGFVAAHGEPTREQLARLDRKRKKKGSNKEWKNPYDGDARIAKMKDGSTHLAHKAEHAVDLSSGALLAITVQGADQGDTTTIHQTLAEAGEAVAELIEHEAATVPTEQPKVHLGGVEEVVADKGYHSGAVLQDLHAVACRSYIPEPERGRRNWEGKEDRAEAGVRQPAADSGGAQQATAGEAE